jgi:hypothetical protein
MATSTLTAPAITRDDKCDKCGCQALLRFCLRNGGEVLFCGHHGLENFPKVEDQTRAVFDVYGKIWWIYPPAILNLR